MASIFQFHLKKSKGGGLRINFLLCAALGGDFQTVLLTGELSTPSHGFASLAPTQFSGFCLKSLSQGVPSSAF